MENKNNNMIFDKFTPKQNFFLGVSAALAIFFALGFFVLLGLFMRGSDNIIGKAAGIGVEKPAAAPSAVPSAPQPAGDIRLAAISGQDWVRGKRDAKVSVIEFSDTECPYCKRFHPIMQQLIKEYPNDVNWVYRHFPLTSIHSKAPKEAEATECAGELGGNDGFWKYLDRLFEITPANNGLDPEQLPQIAEEVGINRRQFEECLNSGKYAPKVQDQANQAVAAGGRGTPYSVVVVGDDNIPVSGAVPYEQLKTIIDSVLRK